MRIKIPFTEKALLDFYNFLEGTTETANQLIPGPLIRPPRSRYRMSKEDYLKFNKFFSRKYRQQKIYRFIADLRKAGYLKTKNFDDYRVISWTPKGINKILQTSTRRQGKKKKLDKKYLMVVFDIPEDCRKKRDYFRAMLKLLGYKQFQKSAWISSLDIFQETKNLIRILNLESFAQLLILEKVDLKR